MKTQARFLIVIAIIALSLASVAAASNAIPIAGCPRNFELHPVMEHEMHGHHIGLTVDLNGDGQICVKHLDTYHVHIDNVIK